jgi:hypothetical protein
MTVERTSLARREIHVVVEVSDTTLKYDSEKRLLGKPQVAAEQTSSRKDRIERGLGGARTHNQRLKSTCFLERTPEFTRFYTMWNPGLLMFDHETHHFGPCFFREVDV